MYNYFVRKKNLKSVTDNIHSAHNTYHKVYRMLICRAHNMYNMHYTCNIQNTQPKCSLIASDRNNVKFMILSIF